MVKKSLRISVEEFVAGLRQEGLPDSKLAKVDADSEAGRLLWYRFVPVWMVWNHVRTVACLAASVSLVAALLQM